MSGSTIDQERIWERGWSGHELAQLRRMARMPLAEKLDWLEEAHELVLNLQQSRAPGRVASEPVTPGAPDRLSTEKSPGQSASRLRSEAP